MNDYYSPAAIHKRFVRRTPTDDQPDADRFFQKANDLLPEVANEFGVFLLAALLGDIREIIVLKKTLGDVDNF